MNHEFTDLSLRAVQNGTTSLFRIFWIRKSLKLAKLRKNTILKGMSSKILLMIVSSSIKLHRQDELNELRMDL